MSDDPNAYPGMRLYELIHFKIGRGERGAPESTELGAKWIGTYRSKAAAEAAVAGLRTQLGFCKWPNGFRIYPVEVDRLGWPEGFTDAEADRSYWDWPLEEIEPP